MTATVSRSVSLSATLAEQAETLAQQLNLSPAQLFATAIENYVGQHVHVSQPEMHRRNEQDAIHQGDIFWVQLEHSSELEAGIPHPYVVIQDDLFNQSRINTVVACALTSNIRRVSETPGNILLDASEANLPKQSVVEVSKVSALDKAQLGEYVGSLSAQRVQQILTGMRFLQMTFFTR